MLGHHIPYACMRVHTRTRAHTHIHTHTHTHTHRESVVLFSLILLMFYNYNNTCWALLLAFYTHTHTHTHRPLWGGAAALLRRCSHGPLLWWHEKSRRHRQEKTRTTQPVESVRGKQLHSLALYCRMYIVIVKVIDVSRKFCLKW